jgi:hypothetical protein
MKKKFYIILLIAGVSIASCKKILEVSPQNQVAAADVLKDVNGYQALVISVYDRMQSYTFYGRDMALEGDALADNIYTVTSLDTRYQGANNNTSGSGYGIWTQAYGAINDLNTVIAGIDAVPAAAGPQTLLKAQLKAEAYALRGLMYFDIARVYGYEPNKVPGGASGFDKSAVIRLTPTLAAADTVRKNRSTITETYAQIEGDLKKAITFYQATYTLTGAVKKPITPYRFTESATHAILGKVYLYSQRYAEAVTEFDAALDGTITVQSLTPITAGTYTAAFKKIPNPESLLELYYNQSVEVTGVTGSNDAPFTYTQPTGLNAANVATFGSQTVPADFYAIFEATDDRRAMFFDSKTSKSGTTVYKWCNKYSGSGGSFTDNIWMIRYADVVLMKAEALANISVANVPTAAGLVTALRTARNATAVVPVTDQATLLTFIQTERRRELFFEGHRWFDLKRLGNGITKAAPTGIATIPATDFRILAPIPSGEVLLNPALPKNPGY